MPVKRALRSSPRLLNDNHIGTADYPDRIGKVFYLRRSLHRPSRRRACWDCMVSILFCRKKSKHGILVWALEPNPAEREYIALICTMNNRHDRVIDYFLLSDTLPFRKTTFNDGRLQRARRLSSLADFYDAVRALWAERSCTFELQRTTFP